MTSIFDPIFALFSPKKAQNPPKKRKKFARTCRIEELEGREMLSATPWTLADDVFAPCNDVQPYDSDSAAVCNLPSAVSTAPTLAPLGAVDSLSQADFDAIRAKYADLGFSANVTDYHVIEIAADELSDEALRDAIDEAATTTDNTLIVLRTNATQNVLTLTEGQLDVNINVATRGNISIVSLGTDPLTINANNQSRIFNVRYGTELALGGLTLTKGQVGAYEGGGAIYNAGKMTMTDCTITDNTAAANSYGGGGIYNYSYATLTITNCTISNNESLSATYGGGGIYNSVNATFMLTDSVISGNKVSTTVATNGGGGIYSAGDASVIDSTIAGNSASNGGGIYSTDAGTLTITNSTVSENSLQQDGSGGGIYKTGTGTLTITNSTISENSLQQDGSGGGIYKTGTGTLTITNSTISENSTSSSNWSLSNGAGIYNRDGALIIINSTIVNNRNASRGGGIYNSGGALTITNSTISGNWAWSGNDGMSSDARTGGGIHNRGGVLTITNSTISENRGGRGAGIYNTGTLTVTYSTISGNVGTQGSDTGGGFYNTGTLTVINCLVSGNNSGSGPYNLEHHGAGFYNTGTLSITNSTIVGNSGSGDTQGIYSIGETAAVIINNSIVAHNIDTYGNRASSDIFVVSGTISGKNNLVGNGVGQTELVDGMDGNIVDADPRFIQFTPYATWSNTLWQTWNLHLLPISPAVDAGDNSLAVDAEDNLLLVDLDGGERTLNYIVDIGAYEHGNVVMPPTAPMDLRCSNKTKESITLAWNSDNNAATTSYSVRWRLSSGGTWSTAIVVLGTTATIEGLTHSTPYDFQVRANNGGGSSTWSFLSATTLTQLAVPTGITASSKNSTTLTIGWIAVDNASGYTIQYAANSGFTQNVKTLDVLGGATTSTDLAGLTPGSLYYVRVMAKGTGEYFDSVYSASVSSIPREQLAAPTLGTVTAASTSSVSVAWETVANASGYKVEYRTEEADAPWLEAGLPGNATVTFQFDGTTWWSATIGNLAANTTYEFRVTALGTGTYSDSDPSSPTLPATTLPAADTPAISVQPESATYTQDDTADDLSITASGNGTLTYQWYDDDGAISGATLETFTPSTATVGTAAYYCVVTNSLNGTSQTVTSDPATITVNAPIVPPDTPAISVQPQSATYTRGQAADALSITATGNGTLTYQWYRDGEEISGATSAAYTPSTATVGAVQYYCVVTNTLNGTSETETSNTATITVNASTEQPDTPTITAQPQSATYTQGEAAAALTITATAGNGTLTYQWYDDDGEISDAASATYTPSTATVGFAQYYCVVTNTLNGTSETVTSDPATITVDAPTEPPETPTNLQSTNRASASITLTWDAPPGGAAYYLLEYSLDGEDDWNKVSGPITNTSYTHGSLTAETTFYYRVSAVNDAGTSDPSEVLETKTRPAAPDLDASMGGTIPSEVEYQDTFDVISGTIKNIGEVDSSDYTVTFYASTSEATLFTPGSNINLGSVDMPSLAAGETTTAQLNGISTLLLESGMSYYIGWIISDVEDEANPYNNSAYCSTPLTIIVTPPDTPQNLQSPAKTDNSITLTWDAVRYATGYEIRYRKEGELWSEQSEETNSAILTDLDPFTEYEIQVLAVNSAGESDWSDTIFVTTDKIQLSAPEPLLVIAVDSHTIDVSWEPVEYADGYIVEYSTDNFNDDIREATLDELLSTEVTLTDLLGNQTYSVRVTAIGSGVYENSNPAVGSATTPAILLDTPTLGDVTATGVRTISVSWEEVANASGYEIQYTTDSEFAADVVSKTVDSETFTTELIVPEPGTVYFVRVVAIGTGEYGDSGPSGEKSATTHLSIPALNSTGQTSDSITLSWNDIANAAGYEIRYRKLGGTWREPSPYDMSPVTIGGLDAYAAYEFQVRAVNSVCESDWSDAISVMTKKITLPAPMLDTVTATGSSTINVSWEAVPHADGYVIQYATNSAFAGALTKTVNAKTTSAKLTGLEAGKTYYVRVMAEGSGIYEDSQYCGARSTTTEKIKLSTPKLGKVTLTNTNKISVTWSAVANASGYIIQYATDSAFTIGVGSKTVNAMTTSTELTGLDLGTTYYVRIVATGTGMYGNSDPSKAKSATTGTVKLPTPPMPMGKVNAEDNSITVTWATVPGANGYKVQYSTNAAFSSGVHTLKTEDSTTTSIDITGLAAYTTYYVRVMALGGGAFKNSDYSSAKAIITHKVKLDAPTLGNVVATGSNTINVAWNKMNNASGYTIQYATNASFSGALTKTVNLTSTSTDLTGLKANTTYYIRILATGANAYSNSDYSALTMATTREMPIMSPAVPVKPAVNVTAKKTTISSVTLTWKINSKNKDYTSANYTVTCTPLNTSAKIGEVIIANGKATVVITGLTPKTKYKFSIAATNGQMFQTASVSATTAKYTAVKSLKSTAKTSTSVTLSWKPSSAKGNTDGYVIEVYNSTGKVLLNTVYVAGVNATKFTLTGLKAKTQYTFVVKAAEGQLVSSAAKVKVTTKKK